MSMDENRSTGPDEEESLLVGEYALGLLEGEEHGRVARRVAADPALGAELRMWQSRLSSLDGDYAEVAPPAGVFGRIERRLFPAPAPAAAARGGFWNSLAFWRGLAAVSLAVTAFAIGLSFTQVSRLSPAEFATELVAALKAQEGSGVEFVALYDTATGAVRLTAVAAEPMTDQDYELWMIEASGRPVSMGVIPATRTSFMLPEPIKDHLTSGTMLAISIEPKGGSPTGSPTGPVVAMGEATQI